MCWEGYISEKWQTKSIVCSFKLSLWLTSVVDFAFVLVLLHLGHGFCIHVVASAFVLWLLQLYCAFCICVCIIQFFCYCYSFFCWQTTLVNCLFNCRCIAHTTNEKVHSLLGQWYMTDSRGLPMCYTNHTISSLIFHKDFH